MSFNVAYLTGVPGSGKSTICSRLLRSRNDVEIISFGKFLKERLARKHPDLSYQEMRAASAELISPALVKLVEEDVISRVSQSRSSKHVFIDTHAVTKAQYGFRLTPFSLRSIRALNPTFYITVIASLETISKRMTENSDGRLLLNNWQAETEAILQNTLTTAYSVETGSPSYYLENNSDDEFEGAVTFIDNLLDGMRP